MSIYFLLHPIISHHLHLIYSHLFHVRGEFRIIPPVESQRGPSGSPLVEFTLRHVRSLLLSPMHAGVQRSLRGDRRASEWLLASVTMGSNRRLRASDQAAPGERDGRHATELVRLRASATTEWLRASVMAGGRLSGCGRAQRQWRPRDAGGRAADMRRRQRLVVAQCASNA